MSDMDAEKLKDWLRSNIEVSVVFCDNYGPGNDVYVGLKFMDEEMAFCSARICIPSRHDD